VGRVKKVSQGEQVLLSVEDVAVLLGVCRQTVYNYIYREGLPSIQVGGIRRIRREALDEWLKERETVM
jgi:excisionase family DNA binding protein